MDTSFPRIFRVRQRLDGPQIDDIPGAVAAQLARLKLEQTIKPGQTVAMTAGSRGIANLALVLKSAAEFIKQLGAEPWIVPAMGSHGGATAEGQVAVLRSYGVTAEYCGCPIRASMETVEVCRAAEGFPVHFDRHAYQADHVLVINRVKPHTGFTGPIQSGLMKMLLIGLGKHAGAQVYHRAIKDYSFSQILHSVAREVIQRCRIVGGLALLENARKQTAWIEGVPPNEFSSREPELLQMARQWMPKLPFFEADLLIVDRIGKEISGTGMDTNIIGRKEEARAADGPDAPRIRRIIVRGLTESTHGNACGIGIADFALERAVAAMDPRVTMENCLTAGHPEAGRVPFAFATDRQAILAAGRTVGLVPLDRMRLMWIPDTLNLAEVECSEAYWEDAGRQGLEVLTPPRALPLDRNGMLCEFGGTATAEATRAVGWTAPQAAG